MKEKNIPTFSSKKVYIACDGEEFNNQYDCRLHESNIILQKLQKKFLCNEDAIGCPNINDTNYSEGSSYYWFYLRNTEEVEAFYKLIEKTQDEIQSGWICLEIDWEGVFFTSTLSDGLKYVTKLCDTLGVAMEDFKNE